jgi:hypothetical protein
MKKRKRGRKIMVKITSFRWAEKDDPMFTGRFHVHSVKVKELAQKKVKKDKIKKNKIMRRLREHEEDV